jgi:Glycosyltransferase family 87
MRAARTSISSAVLGLLAFAFIGGLGLLAVLVPVGHGITPKGGGWFNPAVVGGPFTLHPLLVAVPWAAGFVLGLLDWRRPWRVEHLDLLALAGFFPVAMLLSDDLMQAGLWLAAGCLGWLFVRMAGAALGKWRMPELRPAVSSRWLGRAILILLVARIASVAVGNISDVGQASLLGAWRLLHGLPLYGAVSWHGPGGLGVNRPDSYGPFAYYAYIPFAAVFPLAPLRGWAHPLSAVLGTLLPAACFDVLTLIGLRVLGRRLGGRPLAQAVTFAYLLYPFPDLSLMAQANDALIAALCVWAIVVATDRPVARGLLIAAATLTKFLPALLALQFLGVRRGRWRYVLALTGGLAAMLAWPLITSGPTAFLDSTFGYQLLHRGGGTQFSIWTSLPHVVASVARPAFTAVLVLLALSPMVRRPAQDERRPAQDERRPAQDERRPAQDVRSPGQDARPGAGDDPRDDPRRDAALSAALLLGAQLLLGYWFYSYLTWCYPLLIIAVTRVRPEREPGQAADITAGRQPRVARTSM